jgi:hypothetical protein
VTEATKFKPKRQKTGGRKPGVRNVVTREFRATVQLLLDTNADNVSKWLTMVAKGHADAPADPGKALDLLSKLAEYAAPKLARTEITGKDGAPIVIQSTPTDDQL